MNPKYLLRVMLHNMNSLSQDLRFSNRRKDGTWIWYMGMNKQLKYTNGRNGGCSRVIMNIKYDRYNLWAGIKNKALNGGLRLATWCFTNADGFIGQFYVERILVNGWVHSDTRNSQFMGGSDNTNSNFSSICDQNFMGAARNLKGSPTVGGFTTKLHSISSMSGKTELINSHEGTLRTPQCSGRPSKQTLQIKRRNKLSELKWEIRRSGSWGRDELTVREGARTDLQRGIAASMGKNWRKGMSV